MHLPCRAGWAQVEALQPCTPGSEFAGGFPADSHELSAQINISLDRKLMRIGGIGQQLRLHRRLGSRALFR